MAVRATGSVLFNVFSFGVSLESVLFNVFSLGCSSGRDGGCGLVKREGKEGGNVGDGE